MSIVKIVEDELKIEVNDDMRAANITASIMPLIPTCKQHSHSSDHVSSVTHWHQLCHQLHKGYVGAACLAATDLIARCKELIKQQIPRHKTIWV